MAHPPVNTSDLSLDEFLTQIQEFNKAKELQNKKGVKLDFKSIDVFERSLDLLKTLWEGVGYFCSEENLKFYVDFCMTNADGLSGVD